MSNNDELNKITNPKIWAKTPDYYLVSEDKLNDLKNKSIAQDITMLLSSIFFGAFFSTLSANWWLFVAGVAFLLITIYFYNLKNAFIKDMKGSGEVKELKSFTASEEQKNELHIIKAVYGTPPDPNKVVDVTDVLNKKIADNKLSFHVGNNLVVDDPDKGTHKTLDIEYGINNNIIKKRYKEYEDVDLP